MFCSFRSQGVSPLSLSPGSVNSLSGPGCKYLDLMSHEEILIHTSSERERHRYTDKYGLCGSELPKIIEAVNT